MRSHNKERPFACTEDGCDKTFPRKDHLQRHIKNAHNDQNIERTFVCDWEGCDKSFTSRGRLQRHKDVHESKFYCTGYPPCKEIFRKQCTLDAHVKSEHLAVKPFPCSAIDPATGIRCTAGYQTEAALRKHMGKIHSGNMENAHFCMLCSPPDSEEALGVIFEPPSFSSKEELIQHNEEVHPPLCTLCGQRFKSTSNLKSHIDTVHADPESQPSYQCPHLECGSIFNRKHNLTVHIQTVHEHQFRYNCTPDALKSSKHPDLLAWDGANACGAAFKAKSSLDQHVRTHHLGLGNRKAQRKARKEKQPDPSMLTLLTGVGYEEGRDLACAVAGCAFRFSRDRDLRRHMRSAAHDLSDEQIEELLRERAALSGGQFWIGGLDEFDDGSNGTFQQGFFDAASTDPSVPQTPAGLPYSSVPQFGANAKGQVHDANNYFAHDPLEPFDLSLLDDEDAELDLAMGLSGLAPATNVQDGLVPWDMGLEQVEGFSMDM